MNGPVVVAGAGPAGSLLAIYLARRGHDVTVYESRADLRRHDVDAGRSINLALATRGIVPLIDVGVIDRVDAITIPMRGRMVHAVDDPTAHLRREDFERGGLDQDILSPISTLRHVLHHRFRCVNLNLAVSEHLLDQLEIGDGFTKGLALIGIANRAIECPASIASGRSAHRNAPIIKALHRKAEALAGLAAQERFARHLDIVKHDI